MAEFEAAETVIVVELLTIGEKVAVTPLGKPATLKLMFPVKLPLRLIATVYDVAFPWAIVRLEGLTANEKSPAVADWLIVSEAGMLPPLSNNRVIVMVPTRGQRSGLVSKEKGYTSLPLPFAAEVCNQLAFELAVQVQPPVAFMVKLPLPPLLPTC